MEEGEDEEDGKEQSTGDLKGGEIAVWEIVLLPVPRIIRDIRISTRLNSTSFSS